MAARLARADLRVVRSLKPALHRVRRRGDRHRFRVCARVRAGRAVSHLARLPESDATAGRLSTGKGWRATGHPARSHARRGARDAGWSALAVRLGLVRRGARVPKSGAARAE